MIHGASSTCFYLRTQLVNISMRNTKIQPGHTFSRLMVIRKSVFKLYGKYLFWCCCECGEFILRSSKALRRYKNQHCGCGRRRGLPNGLPRYRQRLLAYPLYNTWQGMIQRCHNPNESAYADYGGRGIKVCGAWRKDYWAFHNHIGPRPSPEHSIDRINNDGDYEPGNVRWATRAEQLRNTTRNRWITFRGEKKVIQDWANDLGITPICLRRRIRAWGLEQAMTRPKKAGNPGSRRLKGKPRASTGAGSYDCYKHLLHLICALGDRRQPPRDTTPASILL